MKDHRKLNDESWIWRRQGERVTIKRGEIVQLDSANLSVHRRTVQPLFDRVLRILRP